VRPCSELEQQLVAERQPCRRQQPTSSSRPVRAAEGSAGEGAGMGPQDRALAERTTPTGYMLHVILKRFKNCATETSLS